MLFSLPPFHLRATLLLALAACLGSATAADAPDQPEAASGYQTRADWQGQRYAVAAANPLATQAGVRILQAGGSAVDAAIAVQMVLALVEPQSSGLGGGALILHFDGQQVQAYDGRETAPAHADGTLFLNRDGQPLPFIDAVVGGRSVGTPGTLRVLELAHRQQGRLPWARLFDPAIQLAEQGFAVSPRLHTLLAGEQHLKQDPVAAAYFYDGAGQPWPVGHLLKNPALAAVLRQVANQGPDAFYRGPVAEAIVRKVQGHPGNPGTLSLEDLAAYQARERTPLCLEHTARQPWRICGFPPPSSGAIAIGQILGMLARTDADRLPLQDGLPGADWLYRYHEATRLAFADRAQYVADPDFVPAPGGDWRSLLAPAYLAERARLIDLRPGAAPSPSAPAGQPGALQVSYAPQPDQPEYGTSHISIIDAQGHALAMTSTIEDQFGARQMVGLPGLAGGFLLNNELTDFSFSPADAQGRPIANRVEPGKRPRSSMAPTLVFDEHGQLALSLGSPGGALIIHYTAKTLTGLLHWGLTPQQAVSLPNFGGTGGPLLLEAGRFPESTRQALRARGVAVRELDMTSGLQALQRQPGRLQGGADPRREGVVLGE